MTRQLRRLVPVAAALAVAAGLVGVAYASTGSDPAQPARTSDDLKLDWQARSGGVQLLGGKRDPGVPSVQRLRHDNVDFTVTIAPARPGPNLVRIDAAQIKDGQIVDHDHASTSKHKVWVGTNEDFAAKEPVRAVARPGASGLWAVVDLPVGSGTVLVSHGRIHRVPFAVDTGTTDAASTTLTHAYAGPDGPECLTAATAALLAGGDAATACPSDALSDDDARAVQGEVETLASRGVQEIAVQHDRSARSTAAYDLITQVASSHGVAVVEPGATPGYRNALLVVSGWDDASSGLLANLTTPLEEQPIRNDGVWLAPWLLTPAVVDSTAGSVMALDFDIRSPAAQQFSQTLASLFPGQSPTASGYEAWREVKGGEPSPLTLYAASRAAFMPAQPGHAAHESQVAWFPGGTVTPVGSISTTAAPAPTTAQSSSQSSSRTDPTGRKH